MTDTPLIRAARALALSDSGEDCYDRKSHQQREYERLRTRYGGLAELYTGQRPR